ncbi:MAG: FAD-dependent oxidoreductase, partial [Rhodocyclaceae bacterium]
MGRQRVVVVGAGVAGLVAALQLAARDVDVVVVERAATPGGKMREVETGGARIDSGPTVFTMPWVFEEIFAEAGTSLHEHLRLQPADVLARHAWSEGERLDLYADVERSAEAIGEFAGAAEMRGYRRFCERAQRIYRTLDKTFIHASRPNVLQLVARVGLGGLGDLWNIAPYSTMWRSLGEYFRDPRLQQLFGRYATYCGSSPYLAPATLMLIAHVEQRGVWLVEGGMHRVPQALAQLAAARGAQFRYGVEVAEILVRNGRAAGVRLASGEEIAADAVVSNADVGALADG